MKLLSHENIASIELFKVRLSEGEIMVYESCIQYVLDHCDDNMIYTLIGCENKNELTNGFQIQLQYLLQKYTQKDYWDKELKKRIENKDFREDEPYMFDEK